MSETESKPVLVGGFVSTAKFNRTTPGTERFDEPLNTDMRKLLDGTPMPDQKTFRSMYCEKHVVPEEVKQNPQKSFITVEVKFWMEK